MFGSGHAVGEFLNVYTQPAVLFGMAFAYAVLADNTGNGVGGAK